MGDFKQPLVTIVLTAYNQQDYIDETLDSVFSQRYAHIQLIVIDNASTDGTLARLEKMKELHPDVVLIKNLFNKGLCKAFNQGLALARGKYMVDLSGDDILLPDRIQNQVMAFEKMSHEYAVVFTNARYIDKDGRPLHFHYAVNQKGSAVENVPTGDVYKNILQKYFICTPTMMMRTKTLLELGGYDESLSFEDFDFGVRSSAKHKYYYLDQVLTLKRNSPESLGTQVYKNGSGILESSYVVCNKAYDLNRDQEDFDLLALRIRTFIRKCFYAQEFELAFKFRNLLNFIENPGWRTELLILLCRLQVPVNGIYRFYINNFQKFFKSRKDLAFEIVI
jgi:glycosyltransferase involved in cell wall biosynthesis